MVKHYHSVSLIDTETLTALSGNMGASIALAAEGHTLVTGLHDSVGLWAPFGNRWALVKLLFDEQALLSSGIVQVSISDDGTRILVGDSENKSVVLWSIVKGIWTIVERWAGVKDQGISNYGYRVKISGDGKVIAVADTGYILKEKGPIGAVYMYREGLNGWKEDGILYDDLHGEPYDEMGLSLDMCQDGSVVVMGTPTASFTITNSGDVLAWTYKHGEWLSYQHLLPWTSHSDMAFGHSVAISADASMIVVGSPGYNRIHVYKLSGGHYDQTARILVDNKLGPRNLGHQLAIINNGESIIASCDAKGNKLRTLSSVFCFRPVDEGNWKLSQVIRDDVEEDVSYGASLATSASGDFIVVGVFSTYHNSVEGEGTLAFWSI